MLLEVERAVDLFTQEVGIAFDGELDPLRLQAMQRQVRRLSDPLDDEGAVALSGGEEV